MVDTIKYQTHHNGPLKSKTVEFLKQIKAKEGWSYNYLGKKLNISGAFAHNIINKNMNITTNPYMLKIAVGLERLEIGDFATDAEKEIVKSDITKIFSYPLRDEMDIAFVLPKNLTEKEAERLSLFIKSLPQ